MRTRKYRATKVASLSAALAMAATFVGVAGTAAAAPRHAKGFNGSVHFTALGPLTGSYAALGIPIIEGSKAAAYVINKAGGVDGKKLVIDPVDTKGDPADAATALQQEIALNHPAALVGPITLEIHGVQPIFDRFKIPDGWNGGTPTYDNNKDPYLWRCNASDSQQGVAIAGYAALKKYKTAAMLFTTSAASQSFEPIIKKYYTQLGGKVVSTESIQAGLSSYSSEIGSLVASHPQVIFSQLTPGTAAAVFKNLQSLNGLNIPWIGTTFMAGATVIQAITPAVSKAHMVELQGSTALTGAAKKFAQVYKQVNGHQPLSGSGFAYDCTIDFALAMTKAKSFVGSKVNAAMDAVSNPPGITVETYAAGVRDLKAGKKINYNGVSGPMDFNKHHNVVDAWSVVRASGKKTGTVSVVQTITATEITKIIQGKGPKV